MAQKMVNGVAVPMTDAELAKLEADREAAHAQMAEQARHNATLSRADFAKALVRAGKLTLDEAKAWVGAGTLPQIAEDALGLIPDEDERMEATFAAIDAQSVMRGSPLIALIQASAKLSDAEVDALFGLEQA
ncbi:MAG: hypothetical protein AAF330_04170 [Pseudomonadota bacterium]